jgi:PAS domain S-box-containing protein
MLVPLKNSGGREAQEAMTSTSGSGDLVPWRSDAERLSLALAAANLGDWSWDAATDVVTCSTRAAEIFQIPPGPHLTWTAMRELLHADDADRARIAVDRSIETHQDYGVEYRLINGTGERWVSVRGRAVYDSSGGVRGMLGVVQDISDQVRTTEALRRHAAVLRESEERYRAFIDNSSDGIWRLEFDPPIDTALPVDEQVAAAYAHGRFAECNAVMAHMYGLPSPEALVGRTLAFMLPSADPEARAYLASIVEAGYRVSDVESKERGADGTIRWFSNSMTGVVVDGRLHRMWGSQHDVSDRKRAERAQAYLAAIVDSADDAIIAKDLDGIIQSCNAAAERVFGYSAAELVGQPVRILIPAERQGEEDDILARLRRGERVDHFETVRLTRHGRPIDVSLTISPVRDATGVIIGASKIARDITALKAGDRERVRLLEENAAITAALNDVGTIVASDLDRDKTVQAVTDVATELTTAEFGAFFYNVTDADGESYRLYTISGVPREAFAKFPLPRNTEVFEPTFKGTDVVRSADITKDPRYGHNAPHAGMPPGHLPVRSYLAVPVKGRSGHVIGGLFFGHSEVGRFSELHERLAVGVASWASVALENARMYAGAQQASRLKDDFLASLSHELRTPLNAIVGYARMLRTGIIGPERYGKAIETIDRNATSLTQIVEDVLDVSRIVSGKLRLNVQTVEFPDVVRNAIDAVTLAAEARGVRVETVLDPLAAPISGDPERLQQILWNLLSNAVKFTPRGGKVQVRLEQVHSHIEVSVSDTGIGIPHDFLPHLFERFRQADAGSTRERGGLGLGLSIAKQLTEMHGGTIEAASAGVGHGATFRLKIPVMIIHPGRAEAERVHPRASVGSRVVPIEDLRGVHVLAVDDDADAVSLVAEVLEAAGARVTTAQSVAEALHELDGVAPSVLVTDLGMPHLDGFHLIAQVRRHPNPDVRDLPAAALTAYARSDDRVKALKSGFQIHLAKPIDPAELVTTIAALAKRYRPDGSAPAEPLGG